MRDERAEEMRANIRRLRGHAKGAGIDMQPASAYEAVTRQMVDGITEELKEIRGRVNGLLWMVAAAIVLEMTLRIAGLE